MREFLFIVASKHETSKSKPREGGNQPPPGKLKNMVSLPKRLQSSMLMD